MIHHHFGEAKERGPAQGPKGKGHITARISFKHGIRFWLKKKNTIQTILTVYYSEMSIKKKKKI